MLIWALCAGWIFYVYFTYISEARINKYNYFKSIRLFQKY
jgi:predicted membrane protein